MLSLYIICVVHNWCLCIPLVFFVIKKNKYHSFWQFTSLTNKYENSKVVPTEIYPDTTLTGFYEGWFVTFFSYILALLCSSFAPPFFPLTTWPSTIQFTKGHCLSWETNAVSASLMAVLILIGPGEGTTQRPLYQKLRLNGACVIGQQMLWVNHWDVCCRPPELFSIATE